MSNVYFSIVIPTYNRADRIFDTLGSVFDQKFKDYEVIVVDNCSTDNTVEVLEPLIAEKKIRFFQNSENYERSRSRNRGMEEGNGKYLLLLDSDDKLYSDCLSDAYEFSQKHPEHLIFHNLYEFTDEKGKRSKGTKLISKDSLKNISHGNFLACNGVFMSSQLYKTIRFDENKLAIGSEDWDFWLRALAKSKSIGRIDKVNSTVCIHSDRSMLNMNVSNLENTKNYIIDKTENNKDTLIVYESYMNFMKASAQLYLGSMSNLSTEYDKSFQYLKQSIQYKYDIVFTSRFVKIFIKALLGRLKLI